MENTAKSTCCPSSIKLGLVPTLNEANGSTLTDLSRKGTTLVEVSSLKQGQRWSCRSCKSVFSLLHISPTSVQLIPPTQDHATTYSFLHQRFCHYSQIKWFQDSLRGIQAKTEITPFSTAEHTELEASTTFQNEAPNYPQTKFIYGVFHSRSWNLVMFHVPYRDRKTEPLRSWLTWVCVSKQLSISVNMAVRLRSKYGHLKTLKTKQTELCNQDTGDQNYFQEFCSLQWRVQYNHLSVTAF